MNNFFEDDNSKPSIIITPIQTLQLKKWLFSQPSYIQHWIKSTGFDATHGTRIQVPNLDGSLNCVLFGINENPTLWDWSNLPTGLAPNVYRLNKLTNNTDTKNAALAWALSLYKFDRYRQPKSPSPVLIKPSNFDANLVISTYLVRDLINTPANDLGPQDLTKVSKKIAKEIDAKVSVIVGEDLLKKGYPLIHAVGRAHTRAPQLIDIKWGNLNSPKVTLIGKGVCFDTGGLNLKPTSGMALMKKDMGGAAHALGLARMIAAEKLNVRLRVLIPAVENSIAGDAMRPGDVLTSRKGITVEIGNTDAEGRLILADVLTEASTENPSLIIDFATLTGAARVALGTELPALFSNDDHLASSILLAGIKEYDPLWRLPLWNGYKEQIKGKIADLSNSGSSHLGGAITAALFLEHFVDPKIPWAHIDIMAWNTSSKPGRPEGGEAMGMRAVFNALCKKFK